MGEDGFPLILLAAIVYAGIPLAASKFGTNSEGRNLNEASG
jgi:hypothetical protein